MFSARNAVKDVASGFQRHRPEQTLLYKLIDRYYPRFLAHMEKQSRPLPRYVQREFEDYLIC